MKSISDIRNEDKIEEEKINNKNTKEEIGKDDNKIKKQEINLDEDNGNNKYFIYENYDTKIKRIEPLNANSEIIELDKNIDRELLPLSREIFVTEKEKILYKNYKSIIYKKKFDIVRNLFK